MSKQTAPRKALFTLFDRVTHVHFYRVIYYGSGTLIRNLIMFSEGTLADPEDP
jgi:hypothetical protein